MSLFAKSAKRIDLLPTLSSYAGPIPLLVVPIFTFLLLPSLKESSFWCKGKIREAFSAIFKL